MIAATILDPAFRLANWASRARWLFTLTPSRARTVSSATRPAFAAGLPGVTLSILMPYAPSIDPVAPNALSSVTLSRVPQLFGLLSNLKQDDRKPVDSASLQQEFPEG